MSRRVGYLSLYSHIRYIDIALILLYNSSNVIYCSQHLWAISDSMSPIKIGKIKNQIIEKRGWLIGQFIDDPEFRDQNIEIYYKTFPAGDISDKLHYHPQGREYMIILAGRARFQIGDELLILEEGDYIAIPSGTPDQIVEILEEFTIIGVRYPSIPDNKIFIDK